MQEIENPISEMPDIQNQIVDQFIAIRKRTEDICRPLQKEDYVVQPIADVSPPKWHLAHTTWFFETFFISEILPEYQKFDSDRSEERRVGKECRYRRSSDLLQKT